MNGEKFLQIECETEVRYGFGCGYWYVCDDHGCACALANKGFDKEIYERMKRYEE